MFPFIAHLNNGGLLVFIQHQQFTQSFTHCMFSPNLVYPPGEYNDGAIINEGGQRLIGANTLIHIHFANLNATLLSRRSFAIRCSSLAVRRAVYLYVTFPLWFQWFCWVSQEQNFSLSRWTVRLRSTKHVTADHDWLYKSNHLVYSHLPIL